jgi:Zn-dependent protease with chaperone function
MDFFERQDRARRHTGWLIAGFIVAVALIIVAVYLVTMLLAHGGALWRETQQGGIPAVHHPFWWWNPRWFLWSSLGTLAVIGGGAVVKIWELSGGGAVVAGNLGGRLVQPGTTDPDERKLLNVVEEMAIAAGVPVPDVFLLERERGINAFAAGFEPGDAVIGVTLGALRTLSRDELQGVIAHEFSHILNGDMRLNLRLIGWLHGILCVAIVGGYLVRFSGSGNSRGKNSLPLIVIGFVLIVVGWIGVICGRLIKSAVSRQREFLADASAVQFTRNPDGLAGALKKIGGCVLGSRVLSPAAEETSHLFFGNGLRPALLERWFATHPPLRERIRIWDPAFDGAFPKVELPPPPPSDIPSAPLVRPRAQPATPFPGWVAAVAQPRPVPARQALEHAGAPRSEHLVIAGKLLRELPDSLRQAAREPFSAMALVHAGLLGRPGQPETAWNALPAPVATEARRLLPDLRRLAPAARLPLFELSLPALRQLSPRQFDEFERTVRALIEADAAIDLFEYATLKMVGRHLTPRFRKTRRPPVLYYSLTPLHGDCAVLLASLAALDTDDPATIRAAYAAGLAVLKLAPEQYPLPDPPRADLPAVDAALNRLTRVSLPLRRQILQACAATVAHNGRLVGREAELFRAIADTFGCPLPPFPGPVLE